MATKRSIVADPPVQKRSKTVTVAAVSTLTDFLEKGVSDIVADADEKAAKLKARAEERKQERIDHIITNAQIAADRGGGALQNNVYCFSGRQKLSKNALRNMVEQHGGRMVSSITKACTHVVYAPLIENGEVSTTLSSKVEKALHNPKITVLTTAAFLVNLRNISYN